ncbi:hypothetical protein [Shewanella violacea]|uniref:Uncharacterized protein n=1 Tax=Shewanella violacea (strain JCM 10179 / CIP 106290 / LMG 19151 / DSS12) TaxID=637905 RepID=D4ZKC0_SHEVD|nr:hypothetical protein [Shewanella violacea]BAJ02119.1 hypothetical protein SVI_2148 [Shewanella violacea DSS12]
METKFIQTGLFQVKYFDSINAKARASNSVIVQGSHRFKEAIDNMSILANYSLFELYQGVQRIRVASLLTHKSNALEIFRAVICSQISSFEQDILLGYLKQTIDALDDGLKLGANQVLRGLS